MSEEEVVGYTVVDVETTVKNHTIGTNKAFPFAPENEIVLTGERIARSDRDTAGVRILEPTGVGRRVLGDEATQVLIGHNISFDLHYLRKRGYLTHTKGTGIVSIRTWLNKYSVWDTQVAEYILSGQSVLYPSLDYCALKYDAPLKDDRIKIMWEAGVQTEDINTEMLTEYLEGDLEATEIVYLAQLEAAEKSGQLPLIQAMNRAVIAYEDIEWNGMYIDLDLLSEQKDEVTQNKRITEEMLRSQLPSEISQEVNLGSSQQLSILLFGGDYSWKVKEQVGVYKNGNPKFKKVEHTIHDPLFSMTPRPEWHTAKKGIYTTSDEVLAAISNDDSLSPKIHQFVNGLREIRGYDKELSGYYEPLPGLICEGGLLHQNINNVATATGRLSQNQPNLQNMNNKSDLKKTFKSRWGDNGQILEIDYSQLEVIGLAYSCRDPQLLADLKDGLDMHQQTLDKVKHLLPSSLSAKEQRRLVKGINFGFLYGGGVAKQSKITGLPQSVVKKIKKALYDRYPGIKEWQDANEQAVIKSKVWLHEKSKGGYPIHKGTLRTDTGRIYTFKEYDAMPWQKASGMDVSFNRSQICNYPIQGFATGDIVPTVIGEVHQMLMASECRDTCLMINTTHDSITFDVHNDALDKLIVKDIMEIMESAPDLLGEIYGINFDLPLAVEATIGDNWKDQMVIEV